MADDAQKTEEPTPKRLREARSEGQVPLSREVNHFLLLTVATIVIAAISIPTARGITQRIKSIMEKAGQFAISEKEIGELLEQLVRELGVVLLLPALAIFVIAIAASVLQVGPLFSPKRLQPKLNKISPLSGFKRLFSLESIVEFTKGVIKLVLVGAVGGIFLIAQLPNIEDYMMTSVSILLPQTRSLLLGMMVSILAVLLVIAITDVFFQRARHRKRLRMTRQEVLDEFKQIEGDPQIKARIRRIRSERARMRISQVVPSADVVITNPTHYAVALSYDDEQMEAPKVLAKGVDYLAEEIMRLARETNVPLVANPPLARTIYAACEVGEEVLPEHYQAVAEVISYVWRLKGRSAEGAQAA